MRVTSLLNSGADIETLGSEVCCVLCCTYVYMWKNHFCEMKGDVWMPQHEKEREQEDAYTIRQKVFHNYILTSLLCWKMFVRNVRFGEEKSTNTS